MRIRASENSDYIFNPNFGEVTQFRQKFSLLAKQVGQGFTLKAYQVAPTFLIKDKIYTAGGYNFTAPVTQSFENVTQAMAALGLTVAVETGVFLDNSKGLINVNATFLQYSKLGFTLNQLPQIHGIYELNGGDKMIILGVDGVYNFDSQLFKGALDLMPYSDYLERKK